MNRPEQGFIGVGFVDRMTAPSRPRIIQIAAPAKTRSADRLAVFESRSAGRGLVGQLLVDRVQGREAIGLFTPRPPVERPALTAHGLDELARALRPRRLTNAEATALKRLHAPAVDRRGHRVQTALRELRRPDIWISERELHQALQRDRRALRRLDLPAQGRGLISERSDGHGGRTDLRDRLGRTVVELKLGADLAALVQLLIYRDRLTTPTGAPTAHLVCGRMPTAQLLGQAARESVQVWAAGLRLRGGVALAPISGPAACWPWS